MTYPKPLMSITELVAMGFPRETLKDYSRIKNAPIIRTAGGGKILFITEKLDAFVLNQTKQPPGRQQNAWRSKTKAEPNGLACHH